jgi:hypothetical protein
MYRTIDTAFWTDPKVRSLPSDAKLLFLYLVTNTHTHVGGIYYLPDVVIVHETGLAAGVLDTLWDRVSSAGLVRRDPESEVLWVKNMLRYQGYGEKIFRSVAKHIATLHNCPLVNDFLAFYPQVARFVSDRVSLGYSESGSIWLQEQEQEQDIEEESANADSCPETAEPSSGPNEPEPALLTFAVDGNTKTWDLTASAVAKLQSAFPSLDILAEARKAAAWINASPTRRKTARGMPRFLFGWMSRAQERNPSRFSPPPQGNRVDPDAFFGVNP